MLGPWIRANWKWSNKLWQEWMSILGISELRSTAVGEFKLDDHYIYYCGQESLRRNGIALIISKRVRHDWVTELSWFLKCWRSLLPSPVWPLQICLDSWTWHFRFLCNITLYSIWTLLPSPVTSTTGCCFCFGSISSFILELFLHWSLVAYWAPTNLGSSSFSVLSLPFHPVHGVLKARILKWFAIPFSSGPRFVRTLHPDPYILGGPALHVS